MWVHTFELVHLLSQLANVDRILGIALFGWEKISIRFWGSLAENSGFHSNQKLPLTYNGENIVGLITHHLSNISGVPKFRKIMLCIIIFRN